jgi:hypothetical protein
VIQLARRSPQSNIQPHGGTVRSIETVIALLHQQLAALVTFHSTLMQYLQRITPFVNSKDYEFAALARRTYVDGEQQIQSIARTQRALSASIQGLSNELLNQVESLRSHVLRYDGRIESANAAVAIVQQQAAALQREVARVTDGGPGFSRADAPAGSAGLKPGPTPQGEPERTNGGPGFSPASSSSTLAGSSVTEAGSIRRSRPRSADPRPTSASGSPATPRCSTRPATCSMSAADAANSSICCARKASAFAASISTTRWWKSVARVDWTSRTATR